MKRFSNILFVAESERDDTAIQRLVQTASATAVKIDAQHVIPECVKPVGLISPVTADSTAAADGL